MWKGAMKQGTGMRTRGKDKHGLDTLSQIDGNEAVALQKCSGQSTM